MKIHEIFDKEKKTRREPGSKQKLQALMPRFSSAIGEFMQGNVIYRGISRDTGGPSMWLVNPKKHQRASANTINLYTVFIDNDSSWSEYPKRSQSLICATSAEIARGYGNRYVVLLENQSRIGICPKNDFWISFDYMSHKIMQHQPRGWGSIDMSDLNSMISMLYQRLFGKRIDVSDHAVLMAELEKITQVILNTDAADLPPAPYGDSASDNMLMDAIKQYGSLAAALHDLYDPAKNGFRLETMETFSAPPRREIWSDGMAMMIHTSLMDDLEPMFQEFLSKNKI